MPKRTNACARLVASLMLVFTIMFAWCGIALAHGRMHGHDHLSGRHSGHGHRGQDSRQSHARGPAEIPNLDDETCVALNARFETDLHLDETEMYESHFMVAYVNENRTRQSLDNERLAKLFTGRSHIALVEQYAHRTRCAVTFAYKAFSWALPSKCPTCQKWVREKTLPPGFSSDLAKYAAEVVVKNGARPSDIGLDPEFNRATYYFNPKYTSIEMACKFRHSYVRLGDRLIGGHEFYALPTADEQRLLNEAVKRDQSAVFVQVRVIGHGRHKKKIRHVIALPCTPVDALPLKLPKASGP